MFNSNAANEIMAEYRAGRRDFRYSQWRGLYLESIDLRGADLRNSDLSGSDLRGARLDGADLRDAYLNGVDLNSASLEGVNLEGSSLIKACLINTNFKNANFQDSYLTGALLTKSNLDAADLRGAYLNGINITGANLRGTKYDRRTRLAANMEPRKLGMIEREILEESTPIPVEELVGELNQLSEISNRYLGSSITRKYWEESRPITENLKDFSLNRTGRIDWVGNPRASLNGEQVRSVREWQEKFTRSCSSILKNFGNAGGARQMTF